MKKQIILPIISILVVGILFLLSEIFNFTNVININQNEIIVIDSTQYDLDSCAYYLNRTVEFTVDTLEGMKEYKKKKEQELSNCVEENIQLIKRLESNKILPNWRKKYESMEERFKKVEKENINLISENCELKNIQKVEYKLFEPDFSVGNNNLLYVSDSIDYGDNNRTIVNVKIPFLINYYMNGEHINPPNGMYAEIIYSSAEIDVRQDVSILNVITEKDEQLIVESKTSHPNVNVTNEETIFIINKKRIKQLIRKIDPESKIFDVK